MTTTLKFRTNLNCASCVASVKPHLDREQSVERWEVDTTSLDKVLTVVGANVDEDSVKAAVSRAGFQLKGKIPPINQSAVNTSPPVEKSEVTYLPLVLLLSFLIGLVGIVELRMGSFVWPRAMQNFMGGFFVAFAFFKLLNIQGFADTYRMYDVVAKRIPAYGYVYPFIELLLGIAYLTGVQPFATNLVTVVVMTISAIGVVQSLLQKRKIRCACLGTVFNLPMSTVTLIEDVLMIVMAAVMLIQGSHV